MNTHSYERSFICIVDNYVDNFIKMWITSISVWITSFLWNNCTKNQRIKYRKKNTLHNGRTYDLYTWIECVNHLEVMHKTRR